jgi:hypothetical protein
LEVSFIKAELLGIERIQEGTTSLEVLAFGGAPLGISA